MALGGLLIALGHQVWMTLVGAFAMGSFGTLLLVGIQAVLADRHEERQGIALSKANSTLIVDQPQHCLPSIWSQQ